LGAFIFVVVAALMAIGCSPSRQVVKLEEALARTQSQNYYLQERSSQDREKIQNDLERLRRGEITVEDFVNGLRTEYN